MANFDNINIKVFAEQSFEEIKEELEAKAIELDLDLDEGNSGIITKLFDIIAYKEFNLIEKLNYQAKQCFIIFATGDNLDALGVSFATPRNTNEKDDDYRARILLAFDTISNAGTKEAYLYHTKSIDEVLDAQVLSPEPAKVLVFIRSEVENKQELEKQVLDYLNQDHIRAITDLITVSHGTVEIIDFHAKIYAKANPLDEVIIQNRTKDLKQYFKDNEKLKATISVAGIYDALHDNNIRKIDLISPATNLEFAEDKYPVLGDVNLEIIYE
ncbi:baseplate J/gp47 family protein [Francisella philomiragia]|uniref:Baseplate J-like family protein n=1 Tax=Francisella philomiragia TaxID=28110 RepID=A0A0B6CQ96_9GAMM|nr:baseplate J/gp47 family protein [Francisella philomiragia]AJI52649.1 baseplate J-like family protein [Francisella philomiragia]